MSVDTDWLLGPNALEAQLDADPTRILEALVEDGKRSARVEALVARLRKLGIGAERGVVQQGDFLLKPAGRFAYEERLFAHERAKGSP